MNIQEAISKKELFGHAFSDESWQSWVTLLSGFYGLETDSELFYQLTKRNVPKAALNELWLVVGRRGGKSYIAALLAVYEAIFNNHKAKLAVGEVATIMVIAADRKQARTVMRYIRGLLVENPVLNQMVVKDGQDSIELSNRCVIEITTASHRGIRGYTVAAAILDEIAFWHSEGANPDAEILSALRPALTTLNGKLIALSSPYARRGVLWQTYKRYFGQFSDRILVAQAPSLIMNPLLPKDVIQEAYAEDALSAAAEYGANFRTDVEGYVSMEVVDKCTRSSYLELAPANAHRYSAFVDASGGSIDSFTMAIVHMEKRTVVVDAVRGTKPPFSPENVVDDYCKTLKEYRISSVKGDAYAGEWPREQFSKRGVEYKKADMNKSELYRDLLPLLNSERIELPPMKQLSAELLGLERRTARGGRDTIDHAPNSHDDIANAVAGASVYANKDAEITAITGLKIRWPT